MEIETAVMGGAIAALAMALVWLRRWTGRRLREVEARVRPCHRLHVADLPARVPSRPPPAPVPVDAWLAAEDLPPFRSQVARRVIDEDEVNSVLR